MTTSRTLLDHRRAIGPAGTVGRIVVGVALILLPAWGPGWWGNGVQWPDAALGLAGLPAVMLAGQLTRLRFATHQLRATNEITFCVNFAIGAALFSIPFTRDAAALFFGASLLLAAVRGYAGCEVTAISNWLLRRDDQVGCVLFSPIDAVEAQLTGKAVEG